MTHYCLLFLARLVIFNAGPQTREKKKVNCKGQCGYLEFTIVRFSLTVSLFFMQVTVCMQNSLLSLDRLEIRRAHLKMVGFFPVFKPKGMSPPSGMRSVINLIRGHSRQGRALLWSVREKTLLRSIGIQSYACPLHLLLNNENGDLGLLVYYHV